MQWKSCSTMSGSSEKNRNGYKIFEVVLTFIAENCRLNLVKECYNKLRELIVWGYPIALLRLREREFHMEYNDMVVQAGRYSGRGKCGEHFPAV